MKRLLALALTFACSAGYEDPAAFDEPMARIEAAPEQDELGSLEQPWVSGEYHGLNPTSSFACYSGSGDTGDCWFPNLKQIKIQFDTSACYDPPAAGEPVPPLLAITRMITAFKAGMLLWNGQGGAGVTVEDGTCAWSSGCHTTTIFCGEAPGDAPGGANAFGYAYYVGNPKTVITNLPAGPHGHDQAKAITFKNSTVGINVNRVWKYLVGSLPANCQLAGTNAQIDKLVKAIGKHELGHVFGFSDMGDSTDIMYGFMPCSPSGNISTELAAALGIYNSSGAPVTITDVNLENHSP